MALPTSYDTLVTYIRTRLGEPVITINVSNTQIEQRIDDAIAVWQEYHFDGTELQYLKHQISASNLTLSGASVGSFSNGEIVRGATSNAVAGITTVANSTFFQFTYPKPNPIKFQVGETITGNTSLATGIVGSVIQGSYDNEFITVSNAVATINMVLPIGGGLGGERSSGLFSPYTQFIMGDLSSLWGAGGATSYVMAKSNLEMLHDLFVGDVDIRFNRHTDRLYLDLDWSYDVWLGMYIVAEAKVIIDPVSYPDMWSDRFLRDYATALTKKQWGSNLIKYTGVQMPGGVSVNGQAIYDDASKEVTAIEESMQAKYELPPRFIIA